MIKISGVANSCCGNVGIVVIEDSLNAKAYHRLSVFGLVHHMESIHTSHVLGIWICDGKPHFLQHVAPGRKEEPQDICTVIDRSYHMRIWPHIAQLRAC